MTLVSSAHRNDLDVWAYVNDVLQRLLAGETNYEPLLPWNWAAAHPQHIRKFRQEERRDRDLRKTEARATRRARAKLLEARLKKRSAEYPAVGRLPFAAKKRGRESNNDLPPAHFFIRESPISSTLVIPKRRAPVYF